MTAKTRYFKVLHKAGAFIDGVHYPCSDDLDDVSLAIVPLELAADQPAPLWGVEVDVNGNEIAERPDPLAVRDSIGDKLANKIAGDAGLKATGTKAEAEQRKQTIVDTLSLLDHTQDGDWTKDGLPQVDVVAKAAGIDGLTRAELTAAAPDFVRKKPE